MSKKAQKKKLNLKKLIIFIILFIILIVAIWRTVARYTSSARGVGEIEIAMYVVKPDYQSMNISLREMKPQVEPYTYNFSVSNYDDEIMTDVDLEYTLKISTTTNIPLGYKLYLEQNYNDPDAEDIILTNIIEADKYGTYFRKITTEPRNFTYKKEEIDRYQLAIYFPVSYNSIEYQDLIESVEIIIESKQIISEV